MRKRILLFGLLLVVLSVSVGCSNPKRDAKDTNIQEQMESGTLDRT